MVIPYRLLLDSEEVVVHRHPHVRVLFRAVAVALVVLAAAGLLLVAVPAASARGEIVALAALAVLVVTVRPVLHWVTTTLTITDRRLLIRSGVFGRYGRDIPLDRIEEVSFEHTLFERLLGAGTLYVELVTGRGIVVVQNVPRVEDVQNALYELLDTLTDDYDDDELEDEDWNPSVGDGSAVGRPESAGGDRLRRGGR